MSDSVGPHRQQPTRLLHPWDSLGKNTGVGCQFLLQCMKVKSESEVAQSCPTLSDPMTAAYQAPPPPMGFSRQEYWSGVPLPSPPDHMGRAHSPHFCGRHCLMAKARAKVKAKARRRLEGSTCSEGPASHTHFCIPTNLLTSSSVS